MKKLLLVVVLMVSFGALVFSQTTNLFPTTGNVGIGTTTPTQKLEVKDGALFLNTPSADGGTIKSYGHFMDFKGTIGTTDDYYAHRYYRFYPSCGAQGKTYSVIEMFEGNTNFTFEKKVWIATEGPTYFNGGNVGIGTSSPYANLQVGEGTENALLSLGGYSFLGGERSTGEIFMGYNAITKYGAVQENGIVHIRTTSPYGFSMIQSGLNGKIAFYGKSGQVTQDEQANSSENLNLFIDGSKGVGIGTATPAYKLDVVGTIRAREIKVDLNGADFVFEKTYKLMPLD